ncbi:DUF4062 domain-containing protein [Psychrobacter sp. 16-MNA-CIBAN-0192]|uniref:DUF4062 domain-containing protein n=1 Tax=Psychrobacter sp. 16-MNA-CIBAN-0192 TaxID=3140448 RepID=UPI00332E58C3
MLTRRHHLHVICAANDQSLVLDSVAIFFQARAFLTYDVSGELPKAALYGRQCIDNCDYTLLVIGDSYGATQNTGVSQMHLSYLSAKAKLKPMLIFIKSHRENADISPQLKDFIRLVERQNIGIHYYTSNLDIDRLLTHTYDTLLANYPALSWIRETAGDKATLRTSVPSLATPHLSVSANIDHSPVKLESVDNITEALDPTDTFEFSYTAQAYEGGNLTDVSSSLRCTWQEILQALMQISLAFTSYGLKSSINRLITAKVETEIKQQMPNVHAVARCQISQDDLLILQRLLVTANWIELSAIGSRPSQELWKLTYYAKKIYRDSQSALIMPQ